MTHAYTVVKWYKDRVYRVTLQQVLTPSTLAYPATDAAKDLYTAAITDCILAHTRGPIRKRITWNLQHLYAVQQPLPRWQYVCEYTVYLHSADEYQWVCTHYADSVTDTVAPLDAAAEQQLLNGVEIEVRTHLYYKKYQWRIQFKPCGPAMLDIHSAVDSLKDPTQTQQSFRLTKDGILYASDETALTMLKLCIGEYISRITMVLVDSTCAAQQQQPNYKFIYRPTGR